MKYEIVFPKIKFNSNFVQSLNLPQLNKQEILTTNTRTLQAQLAGQKADGGALKGYSASYAAAKSEKTGSSHTNLTVTGEMNRSRTFAQEGDAAMIKFTGSHAIPRRKTQRKTKGSRHQVTNAALAGFLYAKGFTGWRCFGQQDIDRIKQSYSKRIQEKLKTLIDIK